MKDSKEGFGSAVIEATVIGPVVDGHRWLLAALAVVVAGVYLLGDILLPFVAGAFLAWLGNPLVQAMQRRGMRRERAVLSVFGALVLSLLLTLVLLFLFLDVQLDTLATLWPAWLTSLQKNLAPWLHEHFGIPNYLMRPSRLQAMLMSHWQEAGSIASRVLAGVLHSGVGLFGLIANLALVPVVTFYLLRDWPAFLSGTRSLVPVPWQTQADQLAQECDQVLAAFLKGQLLVMLALGCIYAGGLSLLGLELAVLIGLLAGLASIVPYLGMALGLLTALAVALWQFGAGLHLLLVVAVFALGQVLEGWVLTPMLVGNRIGLHPVAVIFAVMAGGELFGVTGMLIALPVAAMLAVLLRHLLQAYRGGAVAIAEAVPEPAAQPPVVDKPLS